MAQFDARNSVRLSKAAINRKDMEGVLECMVDARFSCGDIVDQFTRTLAGYFECAGGVIFRDYRSAVSCSYALAAPAGAQTGSREQPPQRVLLSPLAPACWLHESLRGGGARGATRGAVENGTGGNGNAGGGGGFSLHYLPIRPGGVVMDTSALKPDNNGDAGSGAKYDIALAATPYGHIEDIQSLRDAAGTLIEDVGEGIGGLYANTPVGSFGDIVIVALEVGDILTAGGGTAVLVRKKSSVARLRRIASTLYPRTSLLTDYNAAIGSTQFNRLEDFIKTRRKYYRRMRALFESPAGAAGAKEEALPVHTAHLLPKAFYSRNITPSALAIITSGNPKEIQEFIRSKGIECETGFADAIARSDARASGESTDANGGNKAAPQQAPESDTEQTPETALASADTALSKTITLPLYPSLVERELLYLLQVISSLP